MEIKNKIRTATTFREKYTYINVYSENLDDDKINFYNGKSKSEFRSMA